ncbi:MAG: glutathione S-transferase family protein [Pseudomonadota bacterium]
MAAFKLYGDPISGNCLKVKWTADFLELDYEWVETDILDKKTRTNEFLNLNPFGQAPCIVFEDGRALSQSNAIVLHLAEEAGERLLPDDPYQRSLVQQWLFWEQNSHEPYIAGRRFRKAYLNARDDEIDAEWLPRGLAALSRLEQALTDTPYLVAGRLTAADICLVAYTRVAPEGGFDLGEFERIRAWLARVEDDLGVTPEGAWSH